MAEKVTRSKISNTEWGLVIGALAIIDLIQLILDLVAIGVIVNYAIEIIVGMTLPFYLHLRGEKMSDPKRFFAFAATFGLEFFIPFVDGFPFWTADGIYNMILAKRRNKEEEKQMREAEIVDKEKQQQIQYDKQLRLENFRRQSAAQVQNEEEREQRRLEQQNRTAEENMIDDDEQDLYDRAA